MRAVPTPFSVACCIPVALGNLCTHPYKVMMRSLCANPIAPSCTLGCTLGCLLLQTGRFEDLDIKLHHLSAEGPAHGSSGDEEPSDDEQRPSCQSPLGSAAVTLDVVCTGYLNIELAYRAECSPGEHVVPS